MGLRIAMQKQQWWARAAMAQAYIAAFPRKWYATRGKAKAFEHCWHVFSPSRQHAASGAIGHLTLERRTNFSALVRHDAFMGKLI
jgi:hypothetical protein